MGITLWSTLDAVQYHVVTNPTQGPRYLQGDYFATCNKPTREALTGWTSHRYPKKLRSIPQIRHFHARLVGQVWSGVTLVSIVAICDPQQNTKKDFIVNTKAVIANAVRGGTGPILSDLMWYSSMYSAQSRLIVYRTGNLIWDKHSKSQNCSVSLTSQFNLLTFEIMRLGCALQGVHTPCLIVHWFLLVSSIHWAYRETIRELEKSENTDSKISLNLNALWEGRYDWSLWKISALSSAQYNFKSDILILVHLSHISTKVIGNLNPWKFVQTYNYAWVFLEAPLSNNFIHGMLEIHELVMTTDRPWHTRQHRCQDWCSVLFVGVYDLRQK